MRNLVGLLPLLLLLPSTRGTSQIGGVRGTELVVPVYATTSGAQGASWSTRLELEADDSVPVDLVLRIFPRGAAPLESRHAASSPPLQIVLGAIDGLPASSGWLAVTASRPVRVISRTGDAVFHGLPPSVALAEGESTLLGGALAGFSPDGKTRYNFGVAEVGGAPVTVRACVAGTYDAGGGPYFMAGPFERCRDLPMDASSSVQVNALGGFAEFPPFSWVRTAELTLTVTRGPGRVVAWATSIDDANRATAWAMAPSAGLAPALGSSSGSLLLTKTGSGTGSVRLDGGEVACGVPCEAMALRSPAAPTARLVASPSPDTLFGGWTGCDEADGTTCTLLDGAARRVTAAFPLSRLSVHVFGFLDVKVSAGAQSTTCAGPIRDCEIPTPPGATVEVGATAWPGTPATDSLAFRGPGCKSEGCTLRETPDPTVVEVESRLRSPGRIVYFGAYPRRIRKGESSVLLVRTSGCSLAGDFTPDADTTPAEPGSWRATPTQTTTYTYECWYSMPGSSLREVERAAVTVEVTGP